MAFDTHNMDHPKVFREALTALPEVRAASREAFGSELREGYRVLGGSIDIGWIYLLLCIRWFPETPKA